VVVGLGVAGVATGVVMIVVGNSNFPIGCNGGQCDNRFDGSNSTQAIPAGSFGPAPTGSAARDVQNPSGKGFLPSPSNASMPSVVSCANSVADGCAGSDYNRKRQQDAGTYSGLESLGTIVAISGGVVLLGGVVWYVVQRPSKEENKSAPSSGTFFYPLIGDKLAGAGLTARF
jgi:hypothetical protein